MKKVACIIGYSLLAVAIACGPERFPAPHTQRPPFTTQCGLTIENGDPALKPEFNQYEQDVLIAYEQYVHEPEFQRPASCRRLNGFRVWIRRDADDNPSHVWFSDRPPPGGTVAGLTYCDLSFIIVGEESPHYSALAHEIGHVLENCKDPLHETWKERGLGNAIGLVSAYWDRG